MDNLLNILNYIAGILMGLTMLSFILAILFKPQHSMISEFFFDCFRLLIGHYASAEGWFLLLKYKEMVGVFFTAMAIVVGLLTVAVLIFTVLYICQCFRKEK